MNKKFFITEEEKKSIKSLYNLNEQGGGDLFKDILSDLFFGTGDDNNELDNNVSDITTSDDDFYKSVLKCLDAKPTRENMLFMYAWRQAEGGKAKNNPFNTTYKLPGATNYNSIGVKNYESMEDGVEATCQTLIQGKNKYGYDKIIDGLRNDVGLTKLSDAVVNSKWGTKDLLRQVSKGYAMGITPKPQQIA